MGCRRERVRNELFDALGVEVYAQESRRANGHPTLQVLFLGQRFAAGGPTFVAWETVLGRLTEIALVQARQGNAEGTRALRVLKRWAYERERERKAKDGLPS